MLSAPVNTCFNPVRVKDGSGYSFYPCGSCPSCLRSKQSKWRQRLDLHQQSGFTTLFVTLTYSNEHLPKITVDPDTLEITYASYTRFTNRRGFGSSKNSFERVPMPLFTSDPNFRYSFIDGSYSYSDLPHFRDNYIFDDSPTFGVCFQKDVQDFVRRLRITLDRDSSLADRDTSFTYFICSEYGPETFRPHYHGLLFFRDSTVASLCNSRYVHECWGKSDLPPDKLEKESQYVSFEGVHSYVSKYVTCSDVLPSFLRHKLFKTFKTSSHSCPIGSEVFSPSDVSYKVRETDLLYPKTYKDKDTGEYITMRLSYSPSLWRRYFPKLLFSGRLDLSIISDCYSRIFQLPLNKPVPNLIKEFNEKFGVGSFRFTPVQTRYISYNPHNLFNYRYSFTRSYLSTDNCYRVTYGHVLSKLLSDPNFIDYYLFGIPQNRTVCNKLLNLRRYFASDTSNDNWCSNSIDYLHHYNLFYTKCFSNSLRRFYETLEHISETDSSLASIISEFYPSFVAALPEDYSSLTLSHGSLSDDILNLRFDCNIDTLYSNNGKLITFDFHSLPRYNNYKNYILNTFLEFNTKRKAYYYENLTGSS